MEKLGEIMDNILLSSAYAQAGAAQPNAFMSFVPFVLIFFVFYFLMIRPQKKKMDQEQSFLGAMKKGDDIYTKSGILGKVHGMTEKIVTLDLGEGNKIKILKSQIGGSAAGLLNAGKE